MTKLVHTADLGLDSQVSISVGELMLLYRVETRITLLHDDIKVTLAEQSFQSQTAFFAPFEGAF